MSAPHSHRVDEGPADRQTGPRVMQDGTRGDDAKIRRTNRQCEVPRLFEDHVHGRSPRSAGDRRLVNGSLSDAAEARH